MAAIVETEVVIVGGGVIGCSIAWHLARAGARDVLVVERNEIGSGTTSCAAGLLGQVRSSAVQTRLIQKTFEAIRGLETELGETVGFRHVGSLRVASTEEREREMEAMFAVARAEGVAVESVDKADAERLVPALDARQARAIGYVPGDGFIDPYQLASAYARAARQRGVTIWTGTSVNGVTVRDGRVTGVSTDRGDVRCRAVVDAAGAWANPVASLAGVMLPQSPVRSHFWITAPRPDIDPDQPVVRLPDAGSYLRQEVGGMLIGCYEPESRAYDAWALAPDFTMTQVERDWNAFLGNLPRVLRFFPALEDAEMVGAMAGLTNYPPDATYLIGRVPEVEGFLVASGCSGLGVTGSGGIGSAIAELVTTGKTSLDLTPFRADRFGRVDPRTPEFRRACGLARSGKYTLAPAR